MFKRRTLVTLVAGALLAAAPAFAQFQERTIKFTNGVNEDHPVGVGVKKMQEVLAAKTGGKMKINAFWGGAAGGDLQATQALRAGTQEMVCTSSSPLVGIVKELGVFDLPFLFANEKEADAVLDGPAGAVLQQEAGRGRPREPGLLGERLPQPDQQQASRWRRSRTSTASSCA